MTDALLTLNRLSAAYADDPDRRAAINDVNFSICFGERAILIGPNGSGKSTLLRAIMSQESIQILTGSFSWNSDFLISNGHSNVRIGYVPQRLEDSLFLDLSVSENIFIALIFGKRRWKIFGNARITRKKAFDLAVKSFPMLKTFESTLVRQLSGGWQAVLALAMAFLRRPDLLILDEVTANLDSQNASLLWETLDNLFQNQNRMSILMVSHDLKFAKHTATTVIFMKDGQVVKTIGNIELANIGFEEFLKEYHAACWG